jgi:hypothetical protein
MKMPKTKPVYKSAGDGRFVPKKEVTAHPDKTYTQQVPVKSPKK